ncbi:helix-turn-helix transcriptional regulator [Candidatus Leptofilum sp.]|uniref:helix-turn-helix transcriptional regulator n=1 Tax=Candidatus Leptofilum sp. TaxID=3241576 RepID=UPI003B5CB9C9
MSQTATRLITLIMLLQRQPNQRAADLAAELGISERTVHRYIGMLEEMGIPVYSERGRHGGFSLARGYRMPPLVFTPEEAVTVHLGTSLVSEVWGKLYEEAAHGALAKLENVLPEAQRQEIAWASRALIATNMNRADQVSIMPLLETLRQATQTKQRVRVWYQGRQQPEPEERDLDVYALAYRWGWWYAIGYCHLRQAVRSFRVDRMDQVMLINESAVIPEDFDVYDYLKAEQPPEHSQQLTITMRFQPEGVFLAKYGRSYWQQMEPQADGSLIVTFGAQDMNVAASTIMSYGSLVEVLSPQALRHTLHDWATAVAEQYKNESYHKSE